jgi:NAD(P)-dependent dehydrogenase (short-subunit alcohol dehydrogenase family)
MAPWSAEDIPDLSGKTAVVTGGNAGLGFETSFQLARHGALVFVASRDEERGRTSVAELKRRLEKDRPETTEDGKKRLVYLPLDLADLDSVKAFAETVSKRTKSLDFLINNVCVCVRLVLFESSMRPILTS